MSTHIFLGEIDRDSDISCKCIRISSVFSFNFIFSSIYVENTVESCSTRISHIPEIVFIFLLSLSIYVILFIIIRIRYRRKRSEIKDFWSFIVHLFGCWCSKSDNFARSFPRYTVIVAEIVSLHRSYCSEMSLYKANTLFIFIVPLVLLLLAICSLTSSCIIQRVHYRTMYLIKQNLY